MRPCSEPGASRRTSSMATPPCPLGLAIDPHGRVPRDTTPVPEQSPILLNQLTATYEAGADKVRTIASNMRSELTNDKSPASSLSYCYIYPHIPIPLLWTWHALPASEENRTRRPPVITASASEIIGLPLSDFRASRGGRDASGRRAGLPIVTAFRSG